MSTRSVDDGAESVDAELWGEYVRRARRYVDTGRQDVDKVEIGDRLAAAREAVLAGDDDWAGLVFSGRIGDLIHRRELARFREWVSESSDDALAALRALWDRDAPSVSERIRAFCDLLPQSVNKGVGIRTTTAAVLLMGLDVQNCPPFTVTPFNAAYTQTGHKPPEKDADEAALYDHALGFLDRFIEEAKARGLQLRHRLDAQSLVWAMQDPDDEPPETIDPAAVQDPVDKRPEATEPPPAPGDPWTPSKVEELAGKLLWDPAKLQEIVDGLKDKGQVIFQGPPGTGKTYVAKRMAEWCQKHGGDFRIVQFHPSYSYEDFVEGFRPTLDGGQAGFRLAKGPLRTIAAKAAANPNATHILVIDEINRGSAAKVLGELYFLLEYRDEEIRLQYSDDPFSLPKNLWFIATMNTTDRSIALVDAALRRRFYFFNFFPDEPPVEGLLDRWLDENNPEAKWVARLVDSANRKVGDRHQGIGPSYFMKEGRQLDEDRVRFIWERAVIPYIEEQCFGDEDRLKEFDYDRLMQESGLEAPQPGARSGPSDGAVDEGGGQAEGGVGDASA